MPRKRRRRSPAPRLSRTHRPESLTVEQWQAGLRRQFAAEARLAVRNLGSQPIFSEFAVTNPDTGRTYRVAIRGDAPGVNYCSCPDYAVNTLGTCKHIEAVLRRLRRRSARALREGFRPPFAEVYVRYGSRREVVLSLGQRTQPAMKRLAMKYFDENGVIRASAFARFDRFVEAAHKLDSELRVYEDVLALVAEVRDADRRSELVSRLCDGANARLWDRLLKVKLYPYQRDGALFAAKAGRAIIADEMGLGKTLQAIAAAELLAQACGIQRVLVICPTSLKSQWQYEIERFSARPALIVEGLMHQRRALYEQEGNFFKIANYDVVHRDVDAIRAWAPDLVILDEAQRIKNWQTRAAKAVKQIESPCAIVLTGTPLENRLEELHSIVEFVDRYRLGPLFAFKDAHEVHEKDSSRVIGYRDLKRVTTTLRPILIRRTKDEVLKQLPPRMDKNFFVPMTDPQSRYHAENREIVARLVAKWQRYRFLSEADQLRLRIALQNMRMSCDSTYLLDHETRHQTKIDELNQLLEEIFQDGEAKVVIFSQWLRMNELVEELLNQRKWKYVHLHGGVPGKERKHLTQALREDKACRVFLSTDAGGVGLNLQSASTVINLDLPWNPAVLEQRIGRVHRLGQSRPVRVVNFVAEHTIEHGMLSLLAFKRSMFAGVLDGASDEVFMGEGAMARFMKTVETATTAVPAAPARARDEGADAPDGRASRGAVKAPAAEKHDETAVDANAAVLGELLGRGAELLQQLGNALSGGRAAGDGASQRPSGPRVGVDDQGRPELRITLPDKSTLDNWAAMIGSVLGMLRPPAS